MRTIDISPATASSTASGVNLTIYNGRYRLVGALYTDASGNVVQFQQDGDTFYRTAPSADISGVTLPNADTPFTLAGIPTGVPVEWLGRCVSSAKVIVYSPPQNPGQPAVFPTVPGYDVTSVTGTAEKYRTWTDSSQHIHARANPAGAAFNCMTDGWVFHRAQ